MQAEFQRDVSHNYLILKGEEAVDTSSYQVRMLAGNVIPSILKCRLQNLDGRELFYYDITSRQSISVFYEERKFRGEDLQMIFGGFVRVMEELTEFLMNPEQLVLQPEYIYLEPETRTVYFCCLPGFHREIQGQFRELTEYILPRLDHEDHSAVILGYGIYRKALEPGLQLETVKEAVYQREEKESGSRMTEPRETAGETDLEEEEERERIPLKEKKKQEKVNRPQKGFPKGLAWCLAAVLAVGSILAAGVLGLIPLPPAELLLAGGIGLLACGTLAIWLSEKKRRKQEETAAWRAKVKKELDLDPVEEYDSVSGEEEEKTGQGKTDQGKTDQGKKDMTGITGTLFEKNREKSEELYGETVVLSAGTASGPAALVSREPGELATIYLEQELTVVGKLANAADAVIPVPTVSRVHARIRKRDGEYYLADLNSRNGTAVNGRMLKGDEEYLLQDEDQVDFAQARYVFVK